MGRTVRMTTVLLVMMFLLPALVHAADATIDFEQPGPGTTITNQYADLGGPGQGVVFGPLPSGCGPGAAAGPPRGGPRR